MRDSGWRTFRPDSLRQLRPRTTTSSRSRICCSSSVLIYFSSQVGKSVMWTEIGAVGSTEQTRLRYMLSAINGVNGAVRRLMVSRM